MLSSCPQNPKVATRVAEKRHVQSNPLGDSEVFVREQRGISETTISV